MQPTQPLIEQEPESNSGVDANGWPIGFFEATAGGFQGDPLVREPQGEYEERLELEKFIGACNNKTAKELIKNTNTQII